MDYQGPAMNKKWLIASIFTMAMTSASITGCATILAKHPDPRDPYENINRTIFNFNTGLDKVIIRPVAKAYHTVLPNFLLKGINNVFSNLEDIPTICNEILQLKPLAAWSDVWRLGINSTLGLLGFFDVATEINLKKHHEDFGSTLAHYGYTNSSYFVLPILGPSTIRDAIGLPVTYYTMTVYPYIQPDSARYQVLSLDLINMRSQLLKADDIIKESIDPYVFVRDAYLQKRNQHIMGTSSSGAMGSSQGNQGKQVSQADIYEAAQ